MTDVLNDGFKGFNITPSCSKFYLCAFTVSCNELNTILDQHHQHAWWAQTTYSRVPRFSTSIWWWRKIFTSNKKVLFLYLCICTENLCDQGQFVNMYVFKRECNVCMSTCTLQWPKGLFPTWRTFTILQHYLRLKDRRQIRIFLGICLLCSKIHDQHKRLQVIDVMDGCGRSFLWGNPRSLKCSINAVAL